MLKKKEENDIVCLSRIFSVSVSLQNGGTISRKIWVVENLAAATATTAKATASSVVATAKNKGKQKREASTAHTHKLMKKEQQNKKKNNRSSSNRLMRNKAFIAVESSFT